MIGQRIADVVIGDRAAVKGGQKIAPTGIATGIGYIRRCQVNKRY